MSTVGIAIVQIKLLWVIFQTDITISFVQLLWLWSQGVEYPLYPFPYPQGGHWAEKNKFCQEERQGPIHIN